MSSDANKKDPFKTHKNIGFLSAYLTFKTLTRPSILEIIDS